MKRRDFLGVMVGGIAAAAAVRTWPFRVFSFPSEVVPGAWEPGGFFVDDVFIESVRLSMAPIPDSAFLIPGLWQPWKARA